MLDLGKAQDYCGCHNPKRRAEAYGENCLNCQLKRWERLEPLLPALVARVEELEADRKKAWHEAAQEAEVFAFKHMKARLTELERWQAETLPLLINSTYSMLPEYSRLIAQAQGQGEGHAYDTCDDRYCSLCAETARAMPSPLGQPPGSKARGKGE